jgi:eukaryotic-like serine/threonine-protein kinase
MNAVEPGSLTAAPPRTLGRYQLLGCLARGGMATVYLARHVGQAGFQRLFALKILHPHLADDESFISMLLDEGRIAARLHHPNVVPILDLGSDEGLHYVVMEYVEGCAFSGLLGKYRDGRPPRLVIPIMLDLLAGLHAAHMLTDDDGAPMQLVHRDVSPQNIMVGADGTARITDFGIARAESRIMSTRPGQLKGKLAFMSPEQIRGATDIDRRSDVFAAGVVLWGALTGRRLFLGSSDAATLTNILQLEVPPPSTIGCKPPPVFDSICLRALKRDPDERFSTAEEMEEALREAALVSGCLGSRREVADWVAAAFGDELTQRRKAIRAATSAGSEPDSGRTSMPSSSGLRMMPAIGMLTPSGVQSGVQAPPQLQRRPAAKLLLALAGAVAIVALVALGARLGRSPKSPPAELAATTQPLSAATPAPVETPDTTARDPVSPAPSAEADVALERAPVERPVSRPPIALRGAPKRELAKAKPEAAATGATSATAQPAKQPIVWQKDSPLPPE